MHLFFDPLPASPQCCSVMHNPVSLKVITLSQTVCALTDTLTHISNRWGSWKTGLSVENGVVTKLSVTKLDTVLKFVGIFQ